MAITTASVSSIENQRKSTLMQDFIDLKNNIGDQILKLKNDITDKDKDKKTKRTNTIEKINKNFNDLVEANFDNFMNANYQKYEQFVNDGVIGADEKVNIEVDFNDFMKKTFESDDSFINILNQLREFEAEATLQDISLELADLKFGVEAAGLKNNIISSTNAENGNVLLSRRPDNKKETGDKNETGSEFKVGSYNTKNDFLDAYAQTTYNNSIKDTEDIYSDKKMQKVMEKIFEKNEIKEINRLTFGVNLSKEKGLAGIIRDLQSPDSGVFLQENQRGGIQIIEKGVLRDITGKDLRKRRKEGKIKYENEKGLKGIDFEIHKLTKILNSAKRSDLQTFAALSGARSDQIRTSKERLNAKNTVTRVGEGNVFAYLCDFNGDGQTSAEADKKKNEKQYREGDIGNVFGQQVLFTIEQAINVQNALSDDGISGERQVIKNIMLNIDLADNRIDATMQAELANFYKDNLFCTKENLVIILKKYPEFKPLFVAAIEKMNGGADELTPDLFDTLIGRDMELLAESQNLSQKQKLRSGIEAYLKAHPEVLGTQNLVYVREDMLGQIMNVLDNLTFTTTNDITNAEGSNIRQTGIEKAFVTKAKGVLLDNVIKNLISVGIYGDLSSIRIPVTFGKSGTVNEGKTKRAWNAGPGVKIGKDGVEITLSVGAEVAEQYNYNSVINAQLDQVKSAKYVGLEGGVVGGIAAKKSLSAGVEAFVGAERIQDPLVGIEQINRQYETISGMVFSVHSITECKPNVYSYFSDKIEKLSTDKKYGKFISNNKNHLLDDAKFISEVLVKKDMVGLLEKEYGTDISAQTGSMNNLLDIIQSGNIEQRRGDVLQGLSHKIEITKLSFGLTTQKLLLGKQSSGNNATGVTDNVNGTGGGTPENNQTGAGAGGDSDIGTPSGRASLSGGSRFGIAGFYVGLRLSTWKNTYLPHQKNLLFTQNEIGTGAAEKFLGSSDLGKYAQYLEAMYNKKYLSATVDDGKIILEYTGTPKIKLSTLLNIHCTDEAKKNFKLEDNKLIIGKVGDIGVYTIALQGGVDRVLCLGTKNLNDAKRIKENNLPAQELAKIEKKETGYTDWTKTKIDGLIAFMSNLPSAEQTVLKGLFTPEGALREIVSTEKITYLSPLQAGQKFKNGTFSITKKADASYEVRYVTNPADKLEIKFTDNLVDHVEENTTTVWTKEIGDGKEIFINFTGKLLQAKKAVDAIYIKGLPNLEKVSNDNRGLVKPAFKEFMNAALKENLVVAKEALNSLLTNQGKELGDINNMLTSGDEKTQSYIIDRFVAIFAYEGKYQGKNIGGIIKGTEGRSDMSKNLKGPSGVELDAQMKEDLVKFRNAQSEKFASTKYEEAPREVKENVFGYTAFYRLAEQGYLMMPIGDTKMIAGSMSKDNITNQTATQAWIINNMKNTKNVNRESPEKAIILENIKRLLPKEDAKWMDESKMMTLLENGNIVNGAKTITLDKEAVFYLMAECVNESIGLRIKKLTVEETKKVKIYKSYTSGAKASEKEYEMDIAMSGKSHSVGGSAKSEEMSVSFKHHQSNPLEKRELDPGTAKTDDHSSSDGNSDGGLTGDGNQTGAGGGGDPE